MSDADDGETDVVTVFLRHGSDVLLFRRSEAVGSYSGRWGAVAGHAEGDPEALSRAEIREEAGLDPESLSFVRRGAPFPVEDPDHGVWRVHPFLFDCPTREVTTNRETATHEWVQPTAILDRTTVPELWESYRRVAPAVAAVREDREHGSEYVSRRAVEVLRDAAAALAAGVDAPADVPAGDDDRARLGALAERLLTARGSMVVVANRVRRVLATAAADRTAAAVRVAAESLLDGLDDARIAVSGSLRGATVATLSRSGTVRGLLARCDPAAVVVAESRPGREGRAVARGLATDLDAPVTLCADAGVAHALDACGVDAVLVGADAVLADGSVVNKVGTRTLAAAAAAADVPVHVAAHTDTVAPPGYDPDLEPRAPAELLGEGAPGGLDVEHPTFDVTPPGHVERYLTERGPLSAAELRAVADRPAWR